MQSGAAFIDSREGSRQLRIGVLAAAMTLLVLAWSPSQAQPRASQTPALGALLPAMPDAGSPVTLRAVNDPRTGLAAFSFAGHEIAPVLHARPGSIFRVDYENAMSTHSTEICVDGPCTHMTMTNLHFHGLHVHRMHLRTMCSR